jgi:hypothetical protein
MENEMTPQEIDELKHLKNQNEILLEKLNGLQYKLQIKEYEEILNPIGPGVAGPGIGGNKSVQSRTED